MAVEGFAIHGTASYRVASFCPLALLVVGPIISNLSSLLATLVNNVYQFSPVLVGW